MKAADKRRIKQYELKLDLIRAAGSRSINFETPAERRANIERAKKDVKYCVERYFPHYATAECADFHIYWAKKVLKDKSFTGFAKWGRGLAKSVWNNVIIPFWVWLNEGDNYFVLISVSQDRAIRLLEDIRAEFEANPQIIADFGEQKNLGSWDEGLWVTKGGFIGQALGFGQSCRGLRVGAKRPKQYNIDDLETKQTIKNSKRQDEMVEYIEEELLPSMDGDYERLTISNNWFAPEMFVRKLSERHPDWFVHEVKAYDPTTYIPTWKSKYKQNYYKNKEKKMGVSAAHAEYNHEAKLKGGKHFKEEYIQWGKAPRLNHFKVISGHWDIAYAGTPTADFNAVRIWGLKVNDFWLLDCFVKQTKMAEAVKFMCSVQKSLPDTVTILWRAESQFWNDEVKRTIDEVEQAEGVKLNITLNPNKRNKYAKILFELESRYQNGRIFYDERLKSHSDTQKGLQQLYGIEPNYSTKDDAPDADAEAISFLSKHISPEKPEGKSGFQVGKYKSKNVW
ncbi:hypothetical protein [Flavobacterium beibuense]|uniref:hypothetical protein n=1 Tax=Flavobacterium beibuense TaxID=657326 RepID=UPI003A8D06A7